MRIAWSLRARTELRRAAVIVASSELWYAATNCYVVAREEGGPALVVDAPPDPPGIAALLAKRDLYPAALLVTHGHVDHVGGAGGFTADTAVTAYIHPDDDFLTLHPEQQLTWFLGVAVGADEAAPFAPPEQLTDLADGQSLELAGFTIDVLHTPGHTPGHCCFYLAGEGMLFSGDQLFAGSIGRTDLRGGDYPTLMRSMADKILVLPEETDVLPGHGPATTLARERLANPFIRELLQR
jgi:hydroxyacylglutathione hydrolase